MNKTQNRILLGLAIAALIAIFCYQVAYGKDGSSEYILGPFKGWNQTSSWIKLAPALMQHDANDQRIEYNILNGSTWNMVNSTDGTTATISFDIAPPGCSYNGDRACSYVISWWTDQLTLDYSTKSVKLTFKTVSQDHVELQDSHGNTIRLIRNDMPQIAKAETFCSRTDLTQDERYTCGYNHGYLDAQTDWNLHRFPPQSGGDNSCPHATEHCNGYAKGYTYEWNILYESQQTPTGPSLDALYNKGISLSHLRNYTGAIEYFDRVLAVDPNDKDALYYKGEVLLALGNYTGAMLYYDRVLAIDPKDVAACCALC